MNVPHFHPMQRDAIRWTYELLPGPVQARLQQAIAVVDAAIAGEPVEWEQLSQAMTQIALAAREHLPPDL
jgi:hypothetical protein